MKKIILGAIIGIFMSIPVYLYAATNLFSDIPADAWYRQAVNRLNKADIIQGYPDNSFKSSNSVNRAEMAVIVDRLIDYIDDNYEKKEPVVINKEMWVNHEIRCGIKAGETPVEQYPMSDEEAGDSAKMEEFCDNMKSLFQESNMTQEEATEIYGALREHFGMIQDGYYGMPSPDIKLPKPIMTTNEFKERMAVRKLDNKTYEIFYYQISCGVNFYYQTVEMEKKAVKKIIKNKVWSASAPC